MKHLLNMCMFLACICAPFISFGQAASPQDSTQIRTLLDSGRVALNIQASKSLPYLAAAKQLMDQRAPKMGRFYAEYYKLLGIYYYRKSLYDSSIYFYDTALVMFKGEQDTLEQSKLNVNLALTYNRKGLADTALVYTLKALRGFEQVNDKKGISISLNIMGQVYYFQDKYAEALPYFRRYLALAIENNDSSEMAGGYQNVGGAWYSLDRIDSSIYYRQKAMLIHEALNNYYGMANGYQNLGTDFSRLEQFDSATFYLEKALAMNEAIDNPNGVLLNTHNLGLMAFKQGQYQKAKRLYERSLAMSLEYEEAYNVLNNYRGLYQVAEETGQYRQAFNMYKLYTNLNDSLTNLEVQERIEELNVEYKTEKNLRELAELTLADAEKEATINQQALTLQRNTYLVAGLVILICFLATAGLWWQRRFKLKKEAQMQAQKVALREAQIQAVLESQEQERKRFAADLHDGMGQLFTALQLNVGKIESQENEKVSLEQRHQTYENTTRLLDEIHDEIRNIAFNLMPPILNAEGLVPALHALVQRLNKQTKLNITFQAFEVSTGFSDRARVALYRVVQEFLNNIMKYAQATTIDIQLVEYESEFLLTIEDNGLGYDLNIFKAGRGNGWRNINSRLNLIKAALEIDTVKGRKNTTVVITVPKQHNVEPLTTNTALKNA